ncbi:MAG TPA: polysaccharide pyruvyl transferase CsaB [Armatimonadota bacterium]|nr:polysaccharide pyruvyl transferase CsaB [Armatimonadota bacterium]HQK94996.1 polysaccharide pyruvyl transferase CsaB [Armatimonadota bacterium]
MTRFLFVGYFGYGNLGDEAVLEALVGRLRERAPEAQVAVVSSDPDATSERLGVEAVPRSPLVGVLRAVTSADVFVMGPGGVLQDATSARSILYYSGLSEAARQAGKRVCLVGNGLGPLRTKLGRLATARVVRGASCLAVRDTESARLARELGARVEPEVTADAALMLRPDVDAAARLVSHLGLEGETNVVGVSLRLWRGSATAPQWAETLASVRKTLGCRFLWLPCGGEEDERLLLEVARLMGGDDPFWHPPLAPRVFLGLCHHLRGLVGMRLHSLIFATSASRPVAGIAYDPKVSYFLSQLGVEPAIELSREPVAPRLWADRVCRALERDPESYATQIAQMQGRSDRNCELLLQYV